jgi:hypothetical protein
VTLFWHDGMKETPKIEGVPEDDFLADLPRLWVAPAPGPPPAFGGFVGEVFDYEKFQVVLRTPDAEIPAPDGSLFIGDKGMITTGTYGENTRLIPVEKMSGHRFPHQLITRSPGHYHDWIRACKGDDAACSNFNVAVPFVEWMLLGAIALRVEGKLDGTRG